MKTQINISKIKQKENSSCNDININMITPAPNTYRNYKDNSRIMFQNKLNRRKKVLSQKTIQSKKNEKTNNTQNKSLTNNSISNLNYKLSSVNYVKPLSYLLNNQLRPINKQFIGYKFENSFFNNIPTSRNNNEYTDRYKFKSKNNTMSNKSKKNKKSTEKNKNKKDTDDKVKKEVILIQANYRGYLFRKKFGRSLTTYSKFREDINTMEKIIKFKSMFFNKLKQIKEQFLKNKNKLGKFINNKNKNNKNNKNLNDPNYRKKIWNKNNSIVKSEKFTIEKYYPNNYDKMKDGKNELIDKLSYNKEKEMYEKKLKELLEENKKIKQKNEEYLQMEKDYNNTLL